MEFAKPIRTLAFSNSDNYLAVGGDEGVLYVLSMPSRSMVVNTIFDSPIRSVGFSNLDRRLAVGSDDGVLALLCPDANWRPVGEIEHSDAAVLTQDWSTQNLVVGRKDGSVTLFETESVFSNFFVPQKEFSMKGPVRSVSLGASSRFLGT
jgi:WD40 repeat protein